MDSTIVVGILSLIGSIVGTLGGILASQKLTNYKIEQLQKEVQKHNGLVERMYGVEGRMNEAEHDIRDLKGKVM